MDAITYSKLNQLKNETDSSIVLSQNDMRSGRWTYSTYSESAVRLCSKHPFYVTEGTEVEYISDNLEIYFGVNKTLKSGSTGYVTSGWIAKGTNKSYTVPNNGYLAITVRKEGSPEIEVSEYDATITIRRKIKDDISELAKACGLVFLNGERPIIESSGSVYTIKIDGYPRVIWNRGMYTPTTKVTTTLTIDTNGTLVFYPHTNKFEVVENGLATHVAGGFVVCCVVIKGVIYGQWSKFYSSVGAEVIPSYYKDHLETKIPEIQTKSMLIGRHGGRVVFVTDYHVENNTRHTGDLVNYLMQNTGIRTMVFGGDAIQSETTAAEAYAKLVEYTKDFAGVLSVGRLFNIIGNHEENNPSADPEYESRMVNTSVIYQLFTDDTSYMIHPLWDGDDGDADFDVRSYYMDDNRAKVRYYFVGCDYTAALPETDVKKIASSMLEVPEGYAVIVFSHIGIRWDSTAGKATYSSGNFPKLLSCLSALDAGTSVTVSYTGGSETYIYTNKARTVVGVICGHCHYDAVAVYDSKIPVISTTTDAYSLPVNPVDGSRPARTKGTDEEQAFDVVQFDVDTKRIYLTRIGGGDDRVVAFGENAGLIT